MKQDKPLRPAKSEETGLDVGGLPVGFRFELTHAYRISGDDESLQPWHVTITALPVCSECGKEKIREWFKGSGETAAVATLKAFSALAKIYGPSNGTDPAPHTLAGGNA
jgi:hypothetical protein